MSSILRRGEAIHPFTTCRRAAGALALLLATGCGVTPRSGIPAAPSPAGTGAVATEPVLPLMTGTWVASERVGSFEIIQERDTTSRRVMHVPYGWTRFHLSFTTADGRLNVSLTDNGAALVVNSRTASGCSASSRYHQYGESVHERHLYDAMAAVLHNLIRVCPRGMEAAGQYRRELGRARRDYPTAMRAMRTRVSTVFRRTERCQNPADPRDPDAWARLHARCND